MGNKIFKGLKFPGMDDYYVLPEAVAVKNENGIVEIQSYLNSNSGDSYIVPLREVADYEAGTYHYEFAEGYTYNAGELRDAVESNKTIICVADCNGSFLAYTFCDIWDDSFAYFQRMDNSGDYERLEITPSGEITVTKKAFAPAGYGLGEIQSRLLELEDIDGTRTNMIPTGWYHLDPALGGITIDGQSMNPVDVRVESFTYGFMTITIFNGGRPVVRRGFTTGTWAPWEWINPPMKEGIEYRTAERHQNKRIFTKAISIGALPNTSAASLPHGITNIDFAFPVSGCMVHNAGNNIVSIPYFESTSNFVGITLQKNRVLVMTGSDASAFNGIIHLKYTKTTN